MTLAKRSELQPGQVFVFETTWPWPLRQVCIVLSKTLDRDIWTGALTAYGDVRPAWEVEVLL